MSLDALERRLAAAAEDAFPPTPEVAGPARGRLVFQKHKRLSPRLALGVALAAAAVAVAAGVLAFSPGARSAIADLLDRVPGISIERTPELRETAFLGTPRYGAPVDLAAARELFGEPLRLPDGVGEPDLLFWLGHPPGDMVTAIYGDETEARLVFSQWKVGRDDLWHKVLSFETRADPVTVDGADGIWIHGPDHGIWYLPPGERDRPGAVHLRAQGFLAGNVLAWERDGIAYRIEADVPLDDALQLARSVEVVR